jgi:hypothetical protein
MVKRQFHRELSDAITLPAHNLGLTAVKDGCVGHLKPQQSVVQVPGAICR